MNSGSITKALCLSVLLVCGSVQSAWADEKAPEVELTPVVVGADLFPTAGTSSLARGRDQRSISLNVVGWSGAVRGVELAYLANINKYGVSGFQGAGLVNATLGAPFKGVQLSGIVGYLGEGIRGVQFAGIGGVALGDVRGVQLSGIGGVAMGSVRGVQASGIGNVALGEFKGLQVAGIGNFVMGKVDGIQIGLVNVAEDSDFSLGLINVMYKGRTHIDLWGTEAGFGFAALKHGGKYWHSIYSVGMRPASEDGAYALGLGLGMHLPLNPRIFLDVDALVYKVNDEETVWDDINTLTTVRALAGFRITEDIAVFAGFQGNVLATNKGDATRFGPFGTVMMHEQKCPAQASVSAWPGFLVGVQFLGKPFEN